MKTVGDLMVPLEDYSHVRADASLSDVVSALAQAMIGPNPDPSRPRDRGTLVQAADGRVLGKLSLWDVLSGLKPNFEPPVDPFGQVDDGLLWSQWLRPDLLDRARAIRAADLLHEPSRDEFIDARAPLDLAVHRLVKGRHLSLLVTRNDDIVGVLRLSDVFKAVDNLLTKAEAKRVPA